MRRPNLWRLPALFLSNENMMMTIHDYAPLPFYSALRGYCQAIVPWKHMKKNEGAQTLGGALMATFCPPSPF